MLRGVGLADPPHVVAHMLKGLLDLVCFGFLFFGDGLTGGGAEAPPVVVIRYLFPPYHAVW